MKVKIHDLESIEKVKHLFKEKGINANLRVADATQLPFPDNFFDVIVSSHVLEHIENDVLCIKECARVLKPGGELILWVPGRINGKATEEEWNIRAVCTIKCIKFKINQIFNK